MTAADVARRDVRPGSAVRRSKGVASEGLGVHVRRPARQVVDGARARRSPSPPAAALSARSRSRPATCCTSRSRIHRAACSRAFGRCSMTRSRPAGLELETEWPRLDEGGTDKLDGWLDDHPDARLVLIDVWPRIRPRVERADGLLSRPITTPPSSTPQVIAICPRHRRRGHLFHTRKAEASDFVETVQGYVRHGGGGRHDRRREARRAARPTRRLHVDRPRRRGAASSRCGSQPDAGTWTLHGGRRGVRARRDAPRVARGHPGARRPHPEAGVRDHAAWATSSRRRRCSGWLPMAS